MTRRPSRAWRLVTGKPEILFTLLVLLVYADPLLTSRNFAGRDLIAYNLPMEKAVHDAYARGALPLWSSEISGGRPLLPNPNAGALYPIRFLLAALPFPLAMRIYPILHWIAAGVGLIFLMRIWGLSGEASLIAAATYAFSGIGVSEVFYPHVQPGMTLLPWLLWILARPMASERKRTVLLGLFFGLDLLAGDVFTIGLALLAMALWIGVGVSSQRRLGLSIAAGTAFLLGCSIAAPQILATGLWIPHTNRAVIGMKLGETLLYSISPWRLLEFVIPYPFGSVWSATYEGVWGTSVFNWKSAGLFASLYAGSFALIGFVQAHRVRTGPSRFARSMVVCSLMLSLLPSLVPRGWRRLPSPLPLRNPEKFAVGALFGLAIAAAIGFDHLRASRRIPRWTLGPAIVLAAAATSAALLPDGAAWLATSAVGAPRFLAPVAGRLIPAALAEAGLLWAATLLALFGLTRATERGRAGAIAVLLLVPVIADRRIARTFRADDIFAPTGFERFVARRDPQGLYRVLGESFYRNPSSLEKMISPSDVGYLGFSRRVWYLQTHAFWSHGTVFNQDFDSGDLARVEGLRKISFLGPEDEAKARLFGALALRWGIRYRDQPPLPGYHRFAGDLLQDWDEHERAFPSLRLLEKWEERDSAISAWKALSSLGEGEVVVESGARGSGAARPGRVQILRDRPENLILELAAADPGWLFILRAFWEWRSVSIDGKPVESFPAHLAYTAVRVPAGQHRLELREILPGGRVSKWGPVLFLFVSLALWRADHREKRFI